jgi:predicted RNA binding protein YcfA (HicA-like mRNA interferase family)
VPKFRRMSGAEVISVFRAFGFEVVSSRGSHTKLSCAGMSATPSRP